MHRRPIEYPAFIFALLAFVLAFYAPLGAQLRNDWRSSDRNREINRPANQATERGEIPESVEDLEGRQKRRVERTLGVGEGLEGGALTEEELELIRRLREREKRLRKQWEEGGLVRDFEKNRRERDEEYRRTGKRNIFEFWDEIRDETLKQVKKGVYPPSTTPGGGRAYPGGYPPAAGRGRAPRLRPPGFDPRRYWPAGPGGAVQPYSPQPPLTPGQATGEGDLWSAGGTIAPAVRGAEERYPTMTLGLPAPPGLSYGEEPLSRVEESLLGLYPAEIDPFIRQFGYDVFLGAAASFTPVTDLPVGPDYIVGPGDSFNIDLWGNVDRSFEVTVDNAGSILIPKVGALQVGGVTFRKMQKVVKQRVSKVFSGFSIYISFSRIRTIDIFVTGEVRQPGSYALHSLSTLYNALFAAGGPTKNGTLRRVQLMRGGKLRAEVDLYDFLVGGDKTGDVRLLPHDTVYVPPLKEPVGVAGAVIRPAIYEMRGSMSVGELIRLAGGLDPVSDLKRVLVERVVSHERRTVVDFTVSRKDIEGRDDKDGGVAALLATPLQPADVVKIFPIRKLKRGVVYLEGNVARPGEYALKPGMGLADLIGSREDLLPGTYEPYIRIVRYRPPAFEPEILSANLSKLLAGDPAENIPLREFDYVSVYPEKDFERKPKVEILGNVLYPGVYELAGNMTLMDLVYLAGNITKNAYKTEVFIQRRRFTDLGPLVEDFRIDLRKAIAGDPEHNVTLYEYDQIFVRTLPEFKIRQHVTLTGELRLPGVYPFREGDRLSDAIRKAGGYTRKAYLYGAVFTRQSVREVQMKRIESFIQRQEEQLILQEALTTTQTLDPNTALLLQKSLRMRRSLLAKLRGAQATGRIIVELAELDQFEDSPFNIELEDGDAITIPRRPSVVNVLGEVYNPNAIIYDPDLTIDEYLELVGGVMDSADEGNLFVIKANGTVISARNNDGWFFGKFKNRLLASGDTILVPKEVEITPYLQTTKDIADILFKLATTAGVVFAAVK